MATEPSSADGHRTPSEDHYQAETQDTRWVPLEDGPGSFNVREVPPLRLLRDMQSYGVMAMMGGGESAEDVDMQQTLNEGDLHGFIENVVVPSVVEPDVHWGDIGEGEFDLASLTANDLMVVVTGMTGQDVEALEEQADNQFPRE